MAKTEGITLYECDRNAEHRAYLAQNAPEVSDWHVIERYNADGVKVTRLLCDACYQAYKALGATQDADFNKFMRGE